MKIILIISICVLISLSASAQQPQQSHEQQQTVTNDDRGQAFIISSTSMLINADTTRSDRALPSVRQYSIFLGSSWAQPQMRARETDLNSLLANIQDESRLETIASLGIRDRFAPSFSFEKVDIEGERNINDLEIQNILAGMFKERRLQRSSMDSIYMVFLDSTLHSTLGAMVAGKHYDAYHGFLNLAGARVHYVVIPFQPDRDQARELALHALLVAALNPAGTSN